MIEFTCPNCRTGFSVRESLAGKKCSCKCGKEFIVPNPRNEPETPAPVVDSNDGMKAVGRKRTRQPPNQAVGCVSAIALAVCTFPVIFILVLAFLGMDGPDPLSKAAWISVLISAGMGLGIWTLMFQAHWSLQAKFRRLGTLKGRHKEEIIAAVGKPVSFTAIGTDVQLLQWREQGYQIGLTFRDGICQGVSHESSS